MATMMEQKRGEQILGWHLNRMARPDVLRPRQHEVRGGHSRGHSGAVMSGAR
jgi:hypothetical protein